MSDGAEFLKILAWKIGKMTQKWAEKRVSWINWKCWSLFFFQCGLYWRFILIAKFLHKSHIWEKSFSWDGLKCSWPIRSQGFESNYSFRKEWRNSQIFCMMIQTHESWKLIENLLGGYHKKWMCFLWLWDTEIDICFTCLCKFKKAKCCFNKFWVEVVRNGFGQG